MADDFPYQVYWSTGDVAGRYKSRAAAFLNAGSIGGYFRFEPIGDEENEQKK